MMPAQTAASVSAAASLATSLPVELSAADRARVDQALRDSRAANTRAQYRSAWRGWAEWAALAGHQALPADPLTIAAYAASWSTSAGRKPIKTAPRRTCATSRMVAPLGTLYRRASTSPRRASSSATSAAAVTARAAAAGRVGAVRRSPGADHPPGRRGGAQPRS